MYGRLQRIDVKFHIGKGYNGTIILEKLLVLHINPIQSSWHNCLRIFPQVRFRNPFRFQKVSSTSAVLTSHGLLKWWMHTQGVWFPSINMRVMLHAGKSKDEFPGTVCDRCNYTPTPLDLMWHLRIEVQQSARKKRCQYIFHQSHSLCVDSRVLGY